MIKISDKRRVIAEIKKEDLPLKIEDTEGRIKPYFVKRGTKPNSGFFGNNTNDFK